MGRKKAGKTSIHSVIFANLTPKETRNIGFTVDINESRINFLGLTMNINDCGGQDELMTQYIKNYPQRVFSNTQVLIYVFDSKSQEQKQDLQLFQEITEKLIEFSPQAKIFILAHKQDLIHQKQRE